MTVMIDPTRTPSTPRAPRHHHRRRRRNSGPSSISRCSSSPCRRTRTGRPSLRAGVTSRPPSRRYGPSRRYASPPGAPAGVPVTPIRPSSPIRNSNRIGPQAVSRASLNQSPAISPGESSLEGKSAGRAAAATAKAPATAGVIPNSFSHPGTCERRGRSAPPQSPGANRREAVSNPAATATRIIQCRSRTRAPGRGMIGASGGSAGRPEIEGPGSCRRSVRSIVTPASVPRNTRPTRGWAQGFRQMPDFACFLIAGRPSTPARKGGGSEDLAPSPLAGEGRGGGGFDTCQSPPTHPPGLSAYEFCGPFPTRVAANAALGLCVGAGVH